MYPNNRQVVYPASHDSSTEYLGRELDEYSSKTEINHTSTFQSSTTLDQNASPDTNVGPKRSILRWWIVEILASVGALLGMLALVVLLQHYDGKRQPSWDRLTLNTAVAALSTLSRTLFMVPVGAAISQGAWIWFSIEHQKNNCRSKLSDLDAFDDASRGAWGSLMLLFRTKHHHLVSIGAMITILTLGFDSFTQQLLSTQYRLVENGDVASKSYSAGEVSRAEEWYWYWRHGASLQARESLFETKAAIYNGVLTEDMTPIGVSCSSGNCTWPTIPSLAVCGECTPQTFTTSCDESQDLCNYTMPSGTGVSDMRTLFSLQTSFVVNQLWNANHTTYNRSDPTIPYLSVFDMFGANYLGTTFGVNTTATQCALWFCIEAYDISVENGIQTQKTLNNWSTVAAVDSPTFNLTANRTFIDIPDYMNTRPESNYMIGGVAIDALSNSLSKVFNGSVTAGMSSATYGYGDNEFVQGIWNGTGDPQSWIKNVALSLTNNVRSMAATNESAAAYSGIARSSEIFVHVRWGWITYPIVLVLLSIAFLALSITESIRGDVSAWKGSPLAVLLMDVNDVVKHRTDRHTDMDGFKNSVGSEKASLMRGPEGWRFSKR
ncbi:hypothetical protein PVAG01_11460 [Phlyctema vagabunda]|uniref:Uncharacterized protein n=1 Tax=Phlyctema vagabunda TaxID=108571 RepID=A0ABR4P2D7_9HELO